MKVKCTSQCQTDRAFLYKVGKEYDIPEELYNANKDKFVKIEKSKKSGQK